MIFLDKETLRKLQMTELEMLVEVDRICRKNNIDYSLDGGTLLGAVRHNGFIPWDDDADIMMTRKEYEKFYTACKKDLDHKKFFLQEFRTDEKYRWGYSKLRRNDTLFLRQGQEHIKCHQGVFIDIFIFDNVPDGVVKRKIHLAMCYLVRKGLYSVVGKNISDNILQKGIYKILSCFPRKFWQKILDTLIQCEYNTNTELISHLTYPNRQEIKYGIFSEYYNEYIEKDFEGYNFKIIKAYDKYLRDLFDDYMILPPVNKRKVHPVSEIKL